MAPRTAFPRASRVNSHAQAPIWAGFRRSAATCSTTALRILPSSMSRSITSKNIERAWSRSRLSSLREPAASPLSPRKFIHSWLKTGTPVPGFLFLEKTDMEQKTRSKMLRCRSVRGAPGRCSAAEEVLSDDCTPKTDPVDPAEQAVAKDGKAVKSALAEFQRLHAMKLDADGRSNCGSLSKTARTGWG